MCSLMEHSERSYREEKARQAQDPKGSFSLPKRPRICTPEWHRARPAITAVFNADYTPGGRRYARYDDPWTVIGPDVYESFATHAEALAWAFKENK